MRRLPLLAVLLVLGCIPGPEDGGPPVACPMVLCDPACGPEGVKTDANGCMTCECNDTGCTGLSEAACTANASCQPKYSEGGCMSQTPTIAIVQAQYVGCEDKPQQCAPLGCRMDCPYGVKLDANGCDTCSCNDAPADAGYVCPALMCALACTNGIALDAHGCDTCACNPPEPAEDAGTICPQTMCAMYCDYGMQIGADGCFTCACNPAPVCPALMCDLACDNGFVLDENGCETCACNPPTTCPADMCAMYCDHGYVQDANGCNTCACVSEDGGVAPTGP